MGKNIKYGEFTFPASTARATSTAKSTKGIPKAMYNAPHAMKDGGYAKGGPKMPAKREPEAVVRKEVALLRKAGAPKAMVRHEVREMSGEMDTPATKKAEVGMMRKAKAPLTMIKEEMMEPVALKKGGMSADDEKTPDKKGFFESAKDNLKEGAMRVADDIHYIIGTERGKNIEKSLNEKYPYRTPGMKKGGPVKIEAKLEKHANMPASKAHGPGAGKKLAKGGVPSYSKVPKFGQMK